jgi:hypothetical protein
VFELTEQQAFETLKEVRWDKVDREDIRRWPNGKIFTDIFTKCVQKTHHDWCGYWQGNKRQVENLAA